MTPRPTFDVVIPAGGRIDGQYREDAGTDIRALAPIGPERRPVLQIVVEALRTSRCTGKIIVVGDPSLGARIAGVDTWLPEGSGGPENILRGLAELEPERQAIVCTSDLPFLTTDGVEAFLAQVDLSADISVGIVKARDYLNTYVASPTSEFVNLRETGPVTMGCLFCLRPAVIARNRRLVEGAFAARKSQWQMASLLGPRLILEYAVRRLSLKAIVGRLETLLSCETDVVVDAPPELAFDIDTPEDYAYAQDARI